MYLKQRMFDSLADRIVYRNLEPVQPGLPSLQDIWQEIGLDTYRVPRKTEPAYAATIVRFLEGAQSARGEAPLRDLLFIGDTRMNDGTAANNLAQHFPLRGFIGADRLQEPQKTSFDGPLMIANRWTQLEQWLDWVRDEGIACDERTAVLVDIDKTFIGARGRNDKVIDAVRVSAVRQTVENVLSGDFDLQAFREVYDQLCDPQYYALTSDNQDYLAYISLMVMSNIFPPDEFWQELQAGRLRDFFQFVDLCDARSQKMQRGLLTTHQEVISNVRQGDPTPFKTFRRREYYATIASMDCLPDETPREDLLAGEILVTAEVADVLTRLSNAGVLTFGISDKPDEASLPPEAGAAAGQQPIHRVAMKVVGASQAD
jgi:hypothetical protein